MKVIEVAVPVPLNKTFHYLPAENTEAENIAGKRVKVQFGKRTMTAYALSVCEAGGNGFKLKRITDIIDDEVVITEESAELAKYISENYVCSMGEAMACVISVSMKTPKRKPKNVLLSEESVYDARHILNVRQKNAVDLINQSISGRDAQKFLIYGITASGKTEVYLNNIEHALSLGRSAIMLIPEISLTTQFVDIVTRRFRDKVGVWHSAVSNTEKYKLYMKAKNGEIKIMLGARSAIFAPFKDLGLIIIDEEHEHTYKQEQKPSYDAREIAFWRGKYHKAPVVLGSATPSLESYKEAIEGRLTLIELPERIDKKRLPEVKVLSLKNRLYARSLLLPETIEAISKTLASGGQIIVFLNRRGYSPSIMCRKCGSVFQCPNCSISMVFHRNPDSLKCHYCGESKKLPIVCSVCASKDISVFGTGTQKVEDELKKMFPSAKIFRLDGDTASSKEAYSKAYKGIKNDEYDILLGTQMIAKGFDFPRVSLVCVVDADTSLYLPDFKSAEKTFQLITQVAGRCGRGDIPGNVIVQTGHPEHYAIEHAKKHDFISFYKAETAHRKKLLYPPYCDVAKIAVRNKDEQKAISDSERLFTLIDGVAKSHELPIKLLGPAPAYIAKLHNTYRRHIIIKGNKDDILKVAPLINTYKHSAGTQISIEIMPSDLI